MILMANNIYGDWFKNLLTFLQSGNSIPSATITPLQTAITPENSPNYYNARGLLNLKVDTDLPTDQEVLNNYNEWRKNNPKAAGQDWKMQLANGVTLTEENVNNKT